MSLDWIVIEAFAVVLDSSLIVYFIDSKLHKKSVGRSSAIIMWSVLTAWGLYGTFYGDSQIAYDILGNLILSFCTFLLYEESLRRKLYAPFAAIAILLTTSMFGATFVGFVISKSISHTLINQDTSRLMTIIFIKMTQAIVFLAFGKKSKLKPEIGKTPGIILIVNTALCIVSQTLLWIYVLRNEISLSDHSLFAVSTACMLLVLIGGFVLYEVFSKLEKENIEMSGIVQRTELEHQYHKEIKTLHNDLQKWRHDYKNNLLAIRGFIDKEDYGGASSYIEKMTGTLSMDKVVIHTGNAALDAIVNSKLWLADSSGIHVNAQTLLKENGEIRRLSISDLCSILGNLLDNAIEACNRMIQGKWKHITLEIFEKDDTLYIFIYNNYDDDIIRDGDDFISSKRKNSIGIGIKYVDELVKRYDGYIRREYNNGVFLTQAMLPLIEPESGIFNEANSSWINKILDTRRHHTPQ